ncbi:MAG: hypothetical protein HYT43_02245 [Candidatus Taylorbacteria bacterium]|nr:hypothetical protein [Candidatus Taylorbacteria bacterium]
MINVEVEKAPNETNSSLIKRFTKKVQSAGILPRVRSIRFKKRRPSKYAKKNRALKVLSHRRALEILIKLGKLPDKMRR